MIDNNFLEFLFNFCLDYFGTVPFSSQPASTDPLNKSRDIVRVASLKAGATSSALALPIGPLGIFTILPDLFEVWQIQKQMISDIASIYGKEAVLSKEVMLYCLFRHGGAMLARDITARAGERFIVNGITLYAIQQILNKIGIRVGEKLLGESLAMLIPILGAIGLGTYAYFDTAGVGTTAIELFSQETEKEGGNDTQKLVTTS